MKRRLIPAILAVAVSLVGGMTVYGHHVDVAATDSDRDAVVTYAKEFDAQRAILIEALQRYMAATSASEKGDAMLLFEDAYSATVEHMDSLYVPECATDLDAFVDAFIEAIGADFAEHKATGEPLEWPRTNEAWQVLVVYLQMYGATICAEEAEV